MKWALPLIALIPLCIFMVVKERAPKERLCLITGCARSGTQFISQVLRLNGVNIRHERDATTGLFRLNGKNCISSWVMAADSDTTPWGPGSEGYQFEHIFHQVRDPIKTINSAANEPEESWQYIRQFVPEIKPNDSKLVRSAKYWYYWNLLAEKKAEWTYRIEDLDVKFDEMAKRLGVSLDPKTIDKVPHNSNTRGHNNRFTWDDLKAELSPELYENIVQLAKRYGYTSI